MGEFCNLSNEEIRKHQSMKKTDRSLQRIEMIKSWANRLKKHVKQMSTEIKS